jgi:hypothetical protein
MGFRPRKIAGFFGEKYKYYNLTPLIPLSSQEQ